MSTETSTLVIALERLNENVQRLDEKHQSYAQRADERHEKVVDKIDSFGENLNKIVVLFEKFAQLERNHEDSNRRVHARIDECKKTNETINEKVAILTADYNKASGAISFLKWMLGLSATSIFSFIIWISTQTVNTQVWMAKMDEWKNTINEKVLK